MKTADPLDDIESLIERAWAGRVKGAYRVVTFDMIELLEEARDEIYRLRREASVLWQRVEELESGGA